MAKGLPYFRWYPADAETDEKYSSLNDAELGFFHRCLNKSWLNDGLPSDLDKLASVMHVTRKYLDRVWPAVQECFQLSQNGHHRIVNRRQEEERSYALSKSQKASDSVRTRYERRTDDLPRAYGSDFESASSSLLRKKEAREEKTPAPGFPQWWNRWVSVTKRGVGEVDSGRNWTAYVNIEDESAAMACLERYLASAEVCDGKIRNPSKFIREESENGWRSTWPTATARAPNGQSSTVDRALATMIDRASKGERPA